MAGGLSFSCRGRSFCPSCEKKRQILWAEWLCQETIPRLLRPLLRRRRELLTELGRAAAEAVSELVRRAMTDRADQAVCLLGPTGTALGCDLELVEPRSAAFVGDFLTPAEQRLVAAAGAERDLVANLVWCGKESALKVLRTGLRRDTRSVEVSLPAEPRVDGWAPLSIRAVEGTVFPGWWQRFGAFVLTLAAAEPFAPPRPLASPLGLATAVPAHAWQSERA